jgi:hypothetical protein
MKLSDIKTEATLIIVDLGEQGRTDAEKTKRFYIQEVAKVKGFWNSIKAFFTREKELVAHFVHEELGIVKQEYFAKIEDAEAYKAKVLGAYKGIAKSLKLL